MRTLRVAVYCLIGGLTITFGAMGTGGFVSWWLAGMLFAAAFVPVAMFGPQSALRQLKVVLPVFLIVSVLCTWSEALLFVAKPEFRDHPVRNLVAPLIMYAIFAIVLSVLALVLKLHRDSSAEIEMRTGGKLALLVLVCGVAYVFYYLLFGGITYQFFTKQYYPDAPAEVAKLGLWFWGIQLCRGVLMTLAVLPAIRTLRMPRWQSAIAIGLLIWITGGAAPLMLPNPYMGATQRFIHVIEIFTQNAPLGFTAVMLLRRKAGATSTAPAAAAQRA